MFWTISKANLKINSLCSYNCLICIKEKCFTMRCILEYRMYSQCSLCWHMRPLTNLYNFSSCGDMFCTDCMDRSLDNWIGLSGGNCPICSGAFYSYWRDTFSGQESWEWDFDRMQFEKKLYTFPRIRTNWAIFNVC